MEQKLRDMQETYVTTLQQMAERFSWPWDAGETPPSYPAYT